MSAALPLVIDRRFNGPPHSANGGYACGAVARRLGSGPATVRLHRPPPLGGPMQVDRTVDGVEVRHGGELVATARPWVDVPEPPRPPTADEVASATAGFDEATYRSAHAFPGCFTCGPARAPGDGLRLFPAPVPGTTTVVWPWSPDPSLAGEDGAVSSEAVWAALDCPGGLAWLMAGDDATGGAAVLGELSVDPPRSTRPRPGEPLLVTGWREGRSGRRLLSGGAVWTAAGDLVAQARATWILLDVEQAEAFGARG